MDVESRNRHRQRVGIASIFEPVDAVVARDGIIVHGTPGRVLQQHVRTLHRTRRRRIAECTADDYSLLSPEIFGGSEEQQGNKKYRKCTHGKGGDFFGGGNTEAVTTFHMCPHSIIS